jgi:hypothetical protein
VPHGLIHDWVAAAFIPDGTVQEIFAVIQDYDNHKNIYKPEVIDSRLIKGECSGHIKKEREQCPLSHTSWNGPARKRISTFSCLY